MPLINKKDFERRVSEAESLLQEVEALSDEGAKKSAVAAIQALLALHADGLARILEVLEENGRREVVGEVARDEVVRGLLILHGLHPVPLEDRIQGALDKVRPYLASHGGDVEVLGVQHGTLRLRLEGSCRGCPSSAMTLKYAIEEALMEAAPDLVGIDVTGVVSPAPAAGFIPLTQIGPSPAPLRPAGEWQPAPGIETLRIGELRSAEVGGLRLAFCRIGDSWYAYGDRCPACHRSLGTGRLRDIVLTCVCGRRFDVRHAGRGLDEDDLRLEPVPLVLEQGTVRVALPAIAKQ